MEVLTDTEGWILIDRCGKHFPLILNFLRDGTVPLPQNEVELKEVLIEAKYYCIEQLVELCEKALQKKKEEHDPICRVPLITSAKEERQLVTGKKPVVKLSYNRSNNKYSYTGQSDDNLLKNIELFDKLSLRFNGRILFIKDLIGNNEICCWTFYGNGKKLAEVCCTSIVYATEKPQTKVEFPDSRIYEESLNVLLYEHRGTGNLPDAELLSATRRAVGPRVIPESDEDSSRKQDKNR